MQSELSVQYEIPPSQLQMNFDGKRLGEGKVMGEATVVYTLFGRARVRVEHEKDGSGWFWPLLIFTMLGAAAAFWWWQQDTQHQEQALAQPGKHAEPVSQSDSNSVQEYPAYQITVTSSYPNAVKHDEAAPERAAQLEAHKKLPVSKIKDKSGADSMSPKTSKTGRQAARPNAVSASRTPAAELSEPPAVAAKPAVAGQQAAPQP